MSGRGEGDLSVFAGLTDLDTLGLKATKVTDVTPLAGLTKLKRLQLSENAITDFSPLKDIYPNLVEKDFELN
jgi:internalin A